MKTILLHLLLISTISLFTACSSKVQTPKVQKQRQIDTQKIKDAYKELDKELQKQQ